MVAGLAAVDPPGHECVPADCGAVGQCEAASLPHSIWLHFGPAPSSAPSAALRSACVHGLASPRLAPLRPQSSEQSAPLRSACVHGTFRIPPLVGQALQRQRNTPPPSLTFLPLHSPKFSLCPPPPLFPNSTAIRISGLLAGLIVLAAARGCPSTRAGAGASTNTSSGTNCNYL